jgi:hypothetical protein
VRPIQRAARPSPSRGAGQARASLWRWVLAGLRRRLACEVSASLEESWPAAPLAGWLAGCRRRCRAARPSRCLVTPRYVVTLASRIARAFCYISHGERTEVFTSRFLAASITKGRMVGSPTPGLMSSWPPNNPGDHNATLESSLCTSPTPPAGSNTFCFLAYDFRSTLALCITLWLFGQSEAASNLLSDGLLRHQVARPAFAESDRCVFFPVFSSSQAPSGSSRRPV